MIKGWGMIFYYAHKQSFDNLLGREKMGISLVVLVVVFVVNLAYMELIRGSQALDTSLPTRRSIIPGTNQKFIYVQDFWTMTWGDGLGASLIATAFVHLVMSGYVDFRQWIVFVAIAGISSLIFLKLCLGKDHKPDYGFPEIGEISTAGILHLPYFGVGIAVSALCVWHILAGNMQDPFMWVGLTGGAIYITCFVADIQSGNFDPLKRISQKV